MLDTLIQSYLVTLEANGRSPKTVAWHQWCLAKYADWLRESGTSENPADWTATTIRTYHVALKHMTKRDGNPLSPQSVRTYALSLRSFCHWLHAEEFVDADIMSRVKQPAAPKVVKAALDSDEIHRILAAAKESRNGLRDYALILFLLDTGARANEVCGLAMADIDWSSRLATVHGKGAKDRHIAFSAITAKAMQKYMLKARRDTSDFLFQSDDGFRLTPSGLLQLTQRIGQRAGVHANPHRFRHTFAITLLRNGANVFDLQKMLGHSSLDMVLRYAALNSDDVISAHAKASPIANLAKGGKR